VCGGGRSRGGELGRGLLIDKLITIGCMHRLDLSVSSVIQSSQPINFGACSKTFAGNSLQAFEEFMGLIIICQIEATLGFLEPDII
jgi:hypothetical protein